MLTVYFIRISSLTLEVSRQSKALRKVLIGLPPITLAEMRERSRVQYDKMTTISLTLFAVSYAGDMTPC